MVRYSIGERFCDLINHILLFLIACLCLYPFIYMLVLAFNSGVDTLKGGITFYPRDFTVANILAILKDNIILNAYKITIMRTVIGTVTGVFITALVAYGLCEKRLPGRKYVMVYLLIPMFLNGGLIPYYLTLRNLGLTNTFWVFVVPTLFNIWNCIVMKTFFQGIPESLKESMRIDGANEIQILFKIIFPVSRPMLAAIALFVAVAHWNSWFDGTYFVSKNQLTPMQTYLREMMMRDMSSFTGKDMANEMQVAGRDLSDYSKVNSLSLKIAAVVVGTAPILIIYPFLQKYFAKGVLIGSIKE